MSVLDAEVRWLSGVISNAANLFLIMKFPESNNSGH